MLFRLLVDNVSTGAVIFFTFHEHLQFIFRLTQVYGWYRVEDGAVLLLLFSFVRTLLKKYIGELFIIIGL